MWVVSTGCTGGLTHIKFCFVIKSVFFLNLYLVCNCIICGNAIFLFLKPRKIYLLMMSFSTGTGLERVGVFGPDLDC